MKTEGIIWLYMVFGIKSSNPLKAPQDVSRQYMISVTKTPKMAECTHKLSYIQLKKGQMTQPVLSKLKKH